MNVRAAVMVCGFVSWVAPVAPADSVVIDASQDTSINSVHLNNSNGAGDSLFSGQVGNMGDFAVLRALIKFDVAGNIPAGSTINSATINVRLRQTGPAAAGTTHSFHRLLAAWGEGASNARWNGELIAAQPGDATWRSRFFPGTLWGTAGGDFAGTVSTSMVSDGVPGFYETWPSTAQLVADVQDMLNNPGGNHGWILRGSEATPLGAHRWASRQDVFPPQPAVPRLTVDFTPPVVPTVSEWGLAITALLLVGGGAAVIRRRAMGGIGP